MKKVYVSSLKRSAGAVKAPGDKSISHRAVIIGSLARGVTKISNFLEAEDTLNTVKIYRSLGVKIEKKKNLYFVHGKGLMSLREPQGELYAGNSGTCIRLSLGVLAAQPFTSVITGDGQVTRRPMKRVIFPLSGMGGKFESSRGHAPITVRSRTLKGISYKMPVASAQVKSSILLAALHCSKPTEVIEPEKSRDHTERMLSYMGAEVKTRGRRVKIYPGKELSGRPVFVPGDVSSAAYFIASGILPGSRKVTIKNVGLNPTRTGIIDVFKKMGAKITIKKLKQKNMEPVGDIHAAPGKLRGAVIKGAIIPRLIDEIPVIAVVAAFARGRTIIRDAGELRVKETDRISAIVKNLRRVGIKVDEKPDGMVICGNGGEPIKYSDIDSFGDHRVAMAFAAAAPASENGLLIKDTECVNTSFPGFFDIFERKGKK